MRLHETCAAFAIAAVIATGAQAQGTESIVRLPDQVEFKAPVTPGPQVAVLYGDPTKAGVYVSRVKLVSGLKLMPHWHPDEWRTAVVLSGTLYFGIGDTWDESKVKAYPSGTFFSEPPKMVHYVWAKDGDVILQITAMGPSGSTPVPPKQ